ncbi:hypothetical protein EDB29_1249 [Vibrio crassostreae]|nr:hypothetical protein EDB29_1249 [Vibrio crassostreae]
MYFVVRKESPNDKFSYFEHFGNSTPQHCCLMQTNETERLLDAL